MRQGTQVVLVFNGSDWISVKRFCHQVRKEAINQLQENCLLIPEMKVETALGNTRIPDNVGNPSTLISLLVKHDLGGIEKSPLHIGRTTHGRGVVHDTKPHNSPRTHDHEAELIGNRPIGTYSLTTIEV